MVSDKNCEMLIPASFTTEFDPSICPLIPRKVTKNIKTKPTKKVVVQTC